MKKKLIAAVLVLVVLAAAGIAAYFIRFGNIRPTLSEGRALRCAGGEVLWIDENGSPTVMTDCTKNKKLLNGLSTGDRILLLHDGVEESYPGRTGVYFLLKLGKGTIGDIPDATLQELSALGWLKNGQEALSFSLTWGCYGISSYDSATGKLVKTTDATHPEDYITEYHPDDQTWEEIKTLLLGLDIESYPDEYDPCEGVCSSPSRTLILTINTGDVQKTVTCRDIALGSEYAKGKGKKFLKVCDDIAGILMNTPEWEALPEYEKFYD